MFIPVKKLLIVYFLNILTIGKEPLGTHIDNIICLTGQPGDVLSPVPSLVEGGDYYEYI